MKVNIRLSKGKLFEVWGHQITFTKFPDFKFAVNPYINNDEEYTGNYTVTEISSGACIAIRKTVKDAIKSSREILHENGIVGTQKAVAAFINKYGKPEIAS